MPTPLPELPSRSIGGIASLIAGNRLECRPRSAEFNRSLRAEVRDSAWMLARQWQLKEFRAEDRGQPVVAEVEVEHSRLNQFRLGDEGIVKFDGDLLPRPLDALVQAQPLEMDAGTRLQMGHHWEKLLRAVSLGATLSSFRHSYPLAAPAAPASGYDLAYGLATTTAETTELLRALAGKAIDGYQLYRDLFRDGGKAADTAGVSRTSSTGLALAQQAQRFTQWYARLYTLPEVGGSAAWSVPDLEYQFEAAAPTLSGEPATLEAREHTGGPLDWYSVDENAAATGYENTDGVAKSETFRFVPTEIQFGGSPNARWWEFEDRKVDFGKITADSSDFGRMLLQEFMFLYQNDWFSLPYTVPAGSLCTVRSVYVTDVFGQRYHIQPAGYSELREQDKAQTPVDLDWGRWGVYALSQKGNRRQSVPRLLLPPTAVAPQVGKPVEQVLLLREESTNLVWGVEQTISDGQGRGMDGAGAAARLTEYLRSQVPDTPRPPALAKLEYQLATPVAENWIPFVPRPAAGDAYELLQGEMVRRVDGMDDFNSGDDTVKPRTTLLNLIPAPQEYVLREHTIPPTGVRVDSAFRRARWYNGETVLWFGRNLGPGRSAGSSGLAYDQLLPRTVRTEAASFGLHAVIMKAGASPAEVDRVRLHPLDEEGEVISGIEIEKTRAQLLAMLRAQDAVQVIYRNMTPTWSRGVALTRVTVGSTEYLKPAGGPANPVAGDEIGPVALPTF